jgi:hypothetical protein
MRRAFLIVWLLLPTAAAAYHFGPGQERLKLDDVAHSLSLAQQHVAAEQWREAIAKYDDALSQLPADRFQEGQQIRLERAKARMLAQQLPQAHEELKVLVDELEGEASTTENGTLLSSARESLANAQYYMTWLMRLEGQPREVWEPEIESSRQLYRLLAEEAESAVDHELAVRRMKDLESAVRLARMDLSELQGLPLPSQ